MFCRLLSPPINWLLHPKIHFLVRSWQVVWVMTLRLLLRLTKAPGPKHGGCDVVGRKKVLKHVLACPCPWHFRGEISMQCCRLHDGFMMSMPPQTFSFFLALHQATGAKSSVVRKVWQHVNMSSQPFDTVL